MYITGFLITIILSTCIGMDWFRYSRKLQSSQYFTWNCIESDTSIILCISHRVSNLVRTRWCNSPVFPSLHALVLEGMFPLSTQSQWQFLQWICEYAMCNNIPFENIFWLELVMYVFIYGYLCGLHSLILVDSHSRFV